jgi:membrane-bound metal-dependent hydrolase YbcI (DUF457 family)
LIGRLGHASFFTRPRVFLHSAHATRRPALDNLTHTLVGAAIAKAGAERATPLATATLVMAANAPDLDISSFVRGEYFALAFRRGITHGWPALVVLPFVVTAGVLAWDRWVRRKRDPTVPPVRPRMIFAFSVLGLLTHPSLDWLNTYGMRWGLPFDGSWTYGDALFIIDPWIWIVLGSAVFLTSSPSRRANWGWALLGLLTTALVVLGMGGCARNRLGRRRRGSPRAAHPIRIDASGGAPPRRARGARLFCRIYRAHDRRGRRCSP